MEERYMADPVAPEHQFSSRIASESVQGADQATELDDEELYVGISKQTLAELKWLADYMGILPSNALRQAIATQAYLEKEIANGNEILIKKPDGLYKATMRPVWREGF